MGRQPIGGNDCQPQLVHGARERAREAGHAHYWQEVPQLAGGDGVERHPCGHRLAGRLCARGSPGPGHGYCGCAGGELRQTEPGDPERRSDTLSHRPDKVVGRAARGTHQEHLGCGVAFGKKQRGRG